MGGIEPQPPERPALLLAEILEGGGNLVDRRPQPLDEAHPGVGQRNAARGAVEETHAEPPLELTHRVAERGRGHAETRRRDPEVQMIGQRDKRPESRNVTAPH